LVIGDWFGTPPRISSLIIQVKSTGTPSSDDAAIVVRSRLGLEPIEVRRFLTGLCRYVFSVMTSDRQKFVVRIATPLTKRLLASGEHWMHVLTLNKQLRQVVDAYTVLFCVDFMS
jgi:hypothetical protein